jgi:hypothetical protein
MKKVVFVLAAAMVLTAAPALFAQDHDQDHVELGVFADYVRLHHADDANFWGIGGRVGFNVHSHVQIEADMAYDFERSFTTTTSTGGTITANRSGLRLLHGMFGPKLMTNAGPVRAFVVLKGGFLNFSTDSSLSGQFGGIKDGDTNGVFYPGGGVEFFGGPVGVRIEAGDLMYFDNGANHNLTMSFGPVFRF